MKALLASLAATVACAPAFSQDLSGVGGAAAMDLDAIAARGVELFEHDRAAWLATEAMLEAVADPQTAGVSGWVMEASDGGFNVTFVSAREGGWVSVYEASISAEGLAQGRVTADAPPVASALARQFEARQAAIGAVLQAGEQLCGQDVNTVVLPIGDASSPSAYDVYVLWATTDPELIVAGGHARLRVAADDLSILEQQNFSRSCLTLPRQENAVGVQMTNGVSPEPNEVHVFLSLANAMPVYVLTTLNGKIWSVEGPDIRLVGEAGPSQ